MRSAADDEGLLLLLFPPSLEGAGAADDCAGASDVGSDGAGLFWLLAGAGCDWGGLDDAGGADDAGGGACELAACGGVDDVGAAAAGDDEAPVPSACCRLPWYRYWLIPSMRMSSKVKADDTAARAKTAPENQAFGNMFGGLSIETQRAKRGLNGTSGTFTLVRVSAC